MQCAEPWFAKLQFVRHTSRSNLWCTAEAAVDYSNAFFFRCLGKLKLVKSQRTEVDSGTSIPRKFCENCYSRSNLGTCSKSSIRRRPVSRPREEHLVRVHRSARNSKSVVVACTMAGALTRWSPVRPSANCGSRARVPICLERGWREVHHHRASAVGALKCPNGNRTVRSGWTVCPLS
jgi:hypothetical protein